MVVVASVPAKALAAMAIIAIAEPNPGLRHAIDSLAAARPRPGVPAGAADCFCRRRQPTLFAPSANRP